MANSTNVISIPKPPADAFNKERPVSELLWEQVEHLAAVVRRQIDAERRAIRTEGEASAFIKKYTEFLHPQGARKRQAPSSKRAGNKPATSSKVARKKRARSSKG